MPFDAIYKVTAMHMLFSLGNLVRAVKCESRVFIV